MTNGAITAIYVALAAGFAAMGVPLALGRVPPNETYGFRTAKTLGDRAIWYAANRVQGIDLIVGGVAMAALALALYRFWRPAPSPQAFAMTMVGLLTATSVAVLVHGFVVLGRM
jgi:uncharacterized membrane protein